MRRSSSTSPTSPAPTSPTARDAASSPTTMCWSAASTPTLISAIQGSGATSPLVGQFATIEGIVVGDYQGHGQFGGYYVQEQAADSDGDPDDIGKRDLRLQYVVPGECRGQGARGRHRGRVPGFRAISDADYRRDCAHRVRDWRAGPAHRRAVARRRPHAFRALRGHARHLHAAAGRSPTRSRSRASAR